MTQQAQGATTYYSGKVGYFEGLDGLRGIATIAVIQAHLQLLDCGWIAMECFFVLSGFLITRVILSDQDRTASFGEMAKRFYLRRVLRVFPVYYTYLLVITAVALITPALAHVFDLIGYAYAYVLNLRFTIEPSGGGSLTVNHLWSMSVEEQFYLIWPLFLAAVPRRHVLKLLLLIIALAPVCRWLMWFYWGDLFPEMGGERVKGVIYFHTLSHLDAFAIGGALNFLRLPVNGRMVAVFALLSYALGAWANGALGVMPENGMGRFALGYPFMMPNQLQAVWGYTLVQLNCALVIAAIVHSPRVRQVTGSRWLTIIGERSYPLYIVHYPILAAMMPLRETCINVVGGSTVLGTLLFNLPYLTVVFLVGHVFHHSIELPAMKLKSRLERRKQPAYDMAGS